MVGGLKRLFLLLLLVALLYSVLSTEGILRIEKYFREEHRDLIYTPKICYLLGNIAYLTYRNELAIDIMSRNLQDFPYESAAMKTELRRAYCYERDGNCGKAIQLYEKFLIRHPKHKRYELIQNRIVKLQTSEHAHAH